MGLWLLRKINKNTNSKNVPATPAPNQTPTTPPEGAARLLAAEVAASEFWATSLIFPAPNAAALGEVEAESFVEALAAGSFRRPASRQRAQPQPFSLRAC